MGFRSLPTKISKKQSTKGCIINNAGSFYCFRCTYFCHRTQTGDLSDKLEYAPKLQLLPPNIPYKSLHAQPRHSHKHALLKGCFAPARGLRMLVGFKYREPAIIRSLCPSLLISSPVRRWRNRRRWRTTKSRITDWRTEMRSNQLSRQHSAWALMGTLNDLRRMRLLSRMSIQAREVVCI